MDRRNFLGSSLAAGLAAVASGGEVKNCSSGEKKRFKLKYAPHFGMFRHHAGKDYIDQIRFISEAGFTAIEDNGMMKRPLETQKKIAVELARLEMTMGVFVASADFEEPTFVTGDPAARELLIEKMKRAVDVAARVGARWVTVVPGARDKKLHPDYQTANAIEMLKRCAEVCEPSGLVMVLEPLNPYVNHPGLFLTGIPQAYQICRAVNSPSCKILDDLYHQQVTEGNLIRNLDAAWDEIAYIQVGDNPGRNEPGTGEINYLNVFKHLYHKGYSGLVGMEHGVSIKGIEGEKALIDAYRKVDAYEA